MSRTDDVEIALVTLARGAKFLGHGLRFPETTSTSAIAGRGAAKLIANGLRELDRFLNLLIDEVAHGLRLSAHEKGSLARQRNTANKMRAVRVHMGLSSPHHHRLRALGRSRDCLFYCAGIVRRSDDRHGTHMTPGWSPGGEMAPLLRLGERLLITPSELVDVCRFYHDIANDLVEALAAHSRRQ